METADDARAQVRAANDRFYEAFSTLDIHRMDAVWDHGEHVACVHPGWEILVGWEAVRESWITIFQNTERMQFRLTNQRVVVSGSVAWVLNTENILSTVGGTAMVGRVHATNIFRRQGETWLVVHHHGSPAVGTPAEEPSPPTMVH